MAQSPSLKLVFEDALGCHADDTPPLYTTSQAVKGSLNISGHVDREFIIKLTFRGDIFNRISFPSRNFVKPPDLTLKHITYKCTIVQQSSSSHAFENDEQDHCVMPFRFPLDRRFLRRVGDLEGSDEIFPPSMKVNALKYGERGAYCHVSYFVKATISCDGMKPVSTTQEVRIVDEMLSPSPPICVADFGAEYICEQERSMKSKIGLSQGRLSISVMEPPPIEIVQDKQRGMARIPVKLIFDGATAGSIQKGLSAIVDWTLKASTFISTVAMRSTPTCELAQNSIFMRHAETTISSGQRKMSLTGWHKSRSNSSDSTIWTLESDLWLSVIPERLLPPTYSSFFLSRRYFITLQMRASGEGAAVFDLQVPVQINFPGGGMIPSRRSSHSTVCSLPQYVK